MRRDPLPWLLLLLLALAGGVAWLTRHPESPVLDRLAELPVVGPLADRFRAVYRPPPPAPAPASAEPEVEIVVLRPDGTATPPAPPATRSAAAPRRPVWVRPGTELRQAPDAASPLSATVSTFIRMRLVERRGDWQRLSRVLADGRVTEGWVQRVDAGEPSAEELWRPEPVLPLPASPPAPEIVALARRLMTAGAREESCGPYALITDAAVAGLAERCARLADGLDRIYARRYGLAPAGMPAEAILVFRSDAAYQLFRSRVAPTSHRRAFAAPAEGIVALAGGGGPGERFQATLAHELTHLLNRRFIGPALPPWLEEGLAEELSMSRFDPDGSLVPGSLGRWEARGTRTNLAGGGRVALAALAADLERGTLPTFEQLVGFDRAAFRPTDGFDLHYPLSAFWVRYLLSPGGPGAGDSFRAFLAAVAAGEPLDAEQLVASLDAGWPELERGFRDWLAAGAGEPG